MHKFDANNWDWLLILLKILLSLDIEKFKKGLSR